MTRFLNLLSFLLLLIGAIVITFFIGFLILSRLTWGFSSWQPIWPLPLTILLIIALGATIHVLLKVIKILHKSTTLFSTRKISQKIYHGLMITISIFMICFIGYIGWSLSHEQPPNFFPFDDPEATYAITKRNDKYSLVYDSKGDKNSVYICDQMSGTTNCRTEVNRNIEVMIGTSSRELESLIGKPVVVTGDFVYSNQQCIAEKCIEIGNWAVLDIYSIETIE